MLADKSFITIHPAAPPKPALGDACNGCGVCCAAEPCPLSRLLLGHRTGSCPALLWRESEHRYFCGLVASPSNFLRWLPRFTQAWFGRLSRRWISTGSGCDFDAEVSDVATD
ncbi:MAG: hypothetical protein K9J42_04420 [Sulfuritalea sp.]|nr:hypothetical protein [Sulfuritalea sp.]